MIRDQLRALKTIVVSYQHEDAQDLPYVGRPAVFVGESLLRGWEEENQLIKSGRGEGEEMMNQRMELYEDDKKTVIELLESLKCR